MLDWLLAFDEHLFVKAVLITDYFDKSVFAFGVLA